MPSIHSVLVAVDDKIDTVIDDERLERLARVALEREGFAPSELCVMITDDATVRELNRTYAGEDASTDVLAFSLREGEEFAAPDGVIRLGEVIISYPTARRQAEEAGWSIDDEVDHLLVHGVLHLVGYDHAAAADEERMQAREQELLAAAGLTRRL